MGRATARLSAEQPCCSVRKPVSPAKPRTRTPQVAGPEIRETATETEFKRGRGFHRASCDQFATIVAIKFGKAACKFHIFVDQSKPGPKVRAEEVALVTGMITLRRILFKAAHSIRSRGVFPTVRAALKFPFRKRYDRGEDYDAQFTVDTAGSDPLWTLVDDPAAVWGGSPYQPVDARDLEIALEALSIDFSKYDFIDVGCGKGKALLVASKFGFRTLLGVEFVDALADIAESNLRRAGIERYLIARTDARRFSFPNTPTVVFMFHPFAAEVMKPVIANLAIDNAQELFIIYCNPVYNGVLERTGKFKKGRSFEGEKSKHIIEVWERVVE